MVQLFGLQAQPFGRSDIVKQSISRVIPPIFLIQVPFGWTWQELKDGLPWHVVWRTCSCL